MQEIDNVGWNRWTDKQKMVRTLLCWQQGDSYQSQDWRSKEKRRWKLIQQPGPFWDWATTHIKHCLEKARNAEMGSPLATRAIENRATAEDARDGIFLIFPSSTSQSSTNPFSPLVPVGRFRDQSPYSTQWNQEMVRKIIWNQWGKWAAESSFSFLLLMVIYQQRASN